MIHVGSTVHPLVQVGQTKGNNFKPLVCKWVLVVLEKYWCEGLTGIVRFTTSHCNLEKYTSTHERTHSINLETGNCSFLFGICPVLMSSGLSLFSFSGARGPGFETYRRRVVSLSKTLYSPKVLVNYPGSDGSVLT